MQPPGVRVLAISGNPGAEGTTTVRTDQVPPNRVWRLRHANLVAERLGSNPVGGELAVYLESDVMGPFQRIAESNLQTGRRVGYAGQGPLGHTLTAGQSLRSRIDVRAGAGLNFFYGVTVLLEEGLG